MMDIRYFHLYNRLVRRNQAEALSCPHCENAYVLAADDDDSPVLRCYTCESTIEPGLNMYERVVSKVSEYFK